MNTQLFVLSVALSCTLAGHAMAMTQAEYSAQKDTVSDQYKAAKEKCSNLKSNAKDICVSQAKGAEKVAKADLEAAYEPSARRTEKAAIARGDAAYDTAKEKCDDLSGNAKSVCRKDAKVLLVTAKEEARVVRVSAETGKVNAAMRKEATAQEKQAQYKAAAQRCEALAGVPKDGCINDTKVKFGMN